MQEKHYWLYVLRLEQGKYYIGITSRKDPKQRIQQHFNGFYSAQWVKKYKPVEVVEIIELGALAVDKADELELKRTLQYMEKYGYQNVRGSKLNYSGKYVKLGYLFFRYEDAKILLAALFMTLTILLLFLKTL